MSADYSDGRQRKRIEILSRGQVPWLVGRQTDLVVQLAGRPVFVNDGILDETDLAPRQRWSSFPTGTVSLAPDETSASGTIVFPDVQLWGKVVKDLRWTFKNGRLIEWSAAENGDLFAESYTSASGDKDRFGFLSIGINPLARPVGFFFNDWLVAGAITGGIGATLDDGGQNDTMFAQYACVRDASLEVDGKPLVEEGKLVI
jgi:leucyl aminopeptidase (aminopeptidase T)